MDGARYLPDALSAVNHLLRDFRTGDVHDIDPTLLDLLHALKTSTGSRRPFEIISGYRSPRTNAMLRSHGGGGVASGSLHMQGQAIDIRVGDVPLRVAPRCRARPRPRRRRLLSRLQLRPRRHRPRSALVESSPRRVARAAAAPRCGPPTADAARGTPVRRTARAVPACGRRCRAAHRRAPRRRCGAGGNRRPGSRRGGRGACRAPCSPSTDRPRAPSAAASTASARRQVRGAPQRSARRARSRSSCAPDACRCPRPAVPSVPAPRIARGVGDSRMSTGPGARAPSDVHSRRHIDAASCHVTSCCSTTSTQRLRRRRGCRCCAARDACHQ